jgi:predicted hydrolase (HD superfamily)
MAKAIIAHAGHSEAMPKTLLEKALYAVEPLTGLIVASALIHPTKKLSSINVKFVMKRFKEKRFGAGAERNQINSCQDFGLDLEEFIGLGLSAMQGISEELGL